MALADRREPGLNSAPAQAVDSQLDREHLMHPLSRMNVRLVRWWLRGGAETCGFCLQTYAHGTQTWCVACDRAVCACGRPTPPAPARAPLCPECAAGDDEGRDGGEGT